jgi:RNA polymerase sigma-70 factor, ECF subfamily
MDERPGPKDERSVMEAAFVAGGEEAFAWAARTHGARLYAAVRRLCDSHEEADDLVQDAFLRAFERRAELREPGALFAWLRRIAVSLALDALRRKKHLRLVALDGAAEAASPERPDTLDFDRARALAERLPPRQREALLMRLSDLSYEETAGAMGCSVGAAKAHVHQAMANLRKMLVLAKSGAAD